MIVPVKPAAAAKLRLSAHLDGAQRAALVRAMLADTLAAVREAHDGPMTLVSSDGSYDDIARRFAATREVDADEGYNAAVSIGLRAASDRGARAALVLPADQPRARAVDLSRLLGALDTAEVVVAPSVDGGTGALGLRPADAISLAFGPQSASAHARLARERGRTFERLACPSLRRDIDTLDDLLASDEPAVGCETARFIEQHRTALAAAVTRL